MNSSIDSGRAVLDAAISTFRLNKGYADKAIAQLPDEKLRVALDPETNSVAVIMKHVAGNLLSRWTDFLTTDGEKPWRQRDNEFIDTFQTRAEILADWEKGWSCLFDALNELQPSDLTKSVQVRGEPHTAILAIDRALAHCAYHVGQIVMVARILAGTSWQTITIPRGKSEEYNRERWGKG